MSNRYDDFDLVFRKVGDRYAVQLINSPTGQAEGEFELPFTDGEMRKFYGRIGQLSRSMRSANSPGMDAAKQFGGKLFDAVFQGELLGRLRASSDTVRGTNRGLRLRLRLRDAPALAELPWEFLYDREQDHFLATSTMTPMVRYLDMAQRVLPLKVHLPLRILVVIAGPKNLQALDAEGEWERLSTSLAALESSGSIVLERLQSGTLDALRRRAARGPFHILHFVGHGTFDPIAGDGCLHFEDEKGMSDPVEGSRLGNILRDHVFLRLVVLNACEGARQSTEDPFSGVAQSLCQQQMPAVIAMQFEISDDAAKRFAEEFYAAIADCVPVDAAVAASRKSMFNGRFGQEWATPVLYMRSPDGLLFDVQRKRVAHPAEPTAGLMGEQERRKAEEAARAGLAETEAKKQEEMLREEQRLETARLETARLKTERLETERQAAARTAAAQAEEARQQREKRAAEAAARERIRAAEAERARQAEEEAKRTAEAEAAEAASKKQAADNQIKIFFENIERARAAKAAADAEQARLAEEKRITEERNAAAAADARRSFEVQAQVEAARKLAQAEQMQQWLKVELPSVPPIPPAPVSAASENRPFVSAETKKESVPQAEPAVRKVEGAVSAGKPAESVPAKSVPAKAAEVQRTPAQRLGLVAVAFVIVMTAMAWGVVVAEAATNGRGIVTSLLLTALGGLVLRFTWRKMRAQWLVWVGFPFFAITFIGSRYRVDGTFAVACLDMLVVWAIALRFGGTVSAPGAKKPK